jgi:hypothetical protein
MRYNTHMISAVVTVVGLVVFEGRFIADNAVINAEVLRTMSPKARKFFLLWGILFAVFAVRGLLPTAIVWLATPGFGVFEAIGATFGGDVAAADAVRETAPLMLCGGGVFLLLLFLHWFLKEEKHFGLPVERIALRHGTWFYLLASIAIAVVTWYSVHAEPLLAFSATIGSTVFFLSHGFKEHAELAEKELAADSGARSDWSKILYLEVIDLCFSIDGVVGSFGFTMNVLLILVGNGIGAVVVRQLTVSNIERIKRYPYLKNGAMYAIGMLATVMILESFGVHVPNWATPVGTIVIIGYFLALCFRRPIAHATA